ncbi:hypothetical protein ACJMK2_041134 [Sinanodonta woodiana]|uniref:MRG-binding protein n=1 Tax=Sinanodonta woodiana TaxID=1069815 RepID=A0ABD3W609_SINWO
MQFSFMGDQSAIGSVEFEVNLFHAMRGHKPVGVNRHFQMMFIQEKINGASGSKNLSAKQIWNHLTTMYDLQALNESEILPFPNKELDFSLPDEEFSDLMQRDFPRMPPSSRVEENSKTEQIKTENVSKETKEGKDTKEKESSGSTNKGSRSDTRHSVSTHAVNTPENSPKRKRTRHNQSASASPATPDAPPTKRRR